MYMAERLIYYLDLVDSGTESIGQRKEEGVHVDLLQSTPWMGRVIEVRCRTQDPGFVYRGQSR